MIAAVRSLRQTVDTLLGMVEGGGATTSPSSIAVPVEEAFLSWANLRPELQKRGIDPVLLERLDKLFTNLVRLTADSAPNRSYRTQLKAIREVVVGGLNDFALATALLPPPMVSPASSRLISEISDVPNELVPRALLGWLPQIRKFLGNYAFENNVFIMIAYREKLEPLLKAIEETVKHLDLNPVVAKDNQLTDDLYNPIANLLSCKYGIAIFDRGEVGQKHNSNVVYELAVMQTLQRPCVLLKHHLVTSMPSDFLHKIYKTYRTRLDAVAQVDSWLRSVKSIN